VEDLRSYIESGILELYAAGDLDPTERLEVEAMLIKHPPLKTQLAEIEKSLEKYAEAYSIPPSDALRNKVLTSLSTTIVDKPIPGNDITMPTRRNSFFKYAFAASVALLILSVGALISLYSRLQDSREQVTALQASNQQFSNRVNYMNEKLSDREQILNVLRNPQYKMIKLKGTKQAPQASMMIAFNPAKKEVMIDMAAMEMPANDTQHQYQLWALVDDKPVDLGVFDMKAGDEGMMKMKAIQNAQAFAVTLEPRGGSQSPTMEQMMLMGEI
jgi:anti-sigma-K factor RskA